MSTAAPPVQQAVGGGGDLLSMFPTVPAPAPSTDPVQAALAKAMAARRTATPAAAPAPPVAMQQPATQAAESVDLLSSNFGSPANPPPPAWTPDSVFGIMDALDGKGVDGSGAGGLPAFGIAAPATAPTSTPPVPFGFAGAAAAAPVLGSPPEPAPSSTAPPPVFGSPDTYGAVPANVPAQPPTVAAPAPVPARGVPTAAEYLANLKRQQEAQFGMAPEPEPQYKSPAPSANQAAQSAGQPAAAVLPASTTAQTELALSDLVFPMDCVCLKKTVVREGFELSSKQA